MNRRAAFLIALSFLLPGASSSQSRALTPVQKIGVGWQPGKWAWMSFVAFSPDGTMVASDGPAEPTDVSGGLTIWSFPEGGLLRRLPEARALISSDWRYYATQNSVRDMASGKTLVSLPKAKFAILAFSPDGGYLAEAVPIKRASSNHIHIVELATGKEVSSFGKRNAFSLAISPDGVTLAAGYWDVVTLWNMLTGERIAVLGGFDGYVEGLSFSKDGKLLGAGTDRGELQIWDIENRKKIQSFNPMGDYGIVSDPAFSPDGKLLAVGVYGTGTAWLIDVATGKVLDSQKISDLGCGSVAFSPDGRFLIAPSTGGLIKWPYDLGGTIRVFEVKAP